MTEQTDSRADVAPGEEEALRETNVARAVRSCAIGFVLAAGLTIGSFWVASGTPLVYVPGVAMALAAFAIAQMGVHLVFFLHITTGPDNLNNVLALAFGVFVVGIVIAGSLWIMFNLDANMVMSAGMVDLHLQP